MNVDDREISLARAGVEALEDEIPRSGDVEQGEILGRRTDEDQIIVLGVVQGEKRAALDPQGTVEHFEDMVELVDGEDFSHAGVVIEDEGALVGAGVEVTHAGLRAAHEAAVAEDHPGLLRAGDEAIPEELRAPEERACAAAD